MTVSARCPYCQSRDSFGDPVRCTGCGAIYHRDCWMDFGGCSVPGCAQAPPDPAPAQPGPATVAASCTGGVAAAAATYPPPGAQTAVAAQPAAATSAELPAAGWFPDPDGADRQRWWDGTAWTGHYYPPA